MLPFSFCQIYKPYAVWVFFVLLTDDREKTKSHPPPPPPPPFLKICETYPAMIKPTFPKDDTNNK